MAAVIPIYSLHIAKYNFPIEIQTRILFKRLLSTTYTANVSFLLHAFKELGFNLCVKFLLALQEKLHVIFYTQVHVFFYYARISRSKFARNMASFHVCYARVMLQYTWPVLYSVCSVFRQKHPPM